jgi:hypothetical protein
MGSGMDKTELLKEIKLYGQITIPFRWWGLAEQLVADGLITLEPVARPNSRWRVAIMLQRGLLEAGGVENDPG